MAESRRAAPVHFVVRDDFFDDALPLRRHFVRRHADRTSPFDASRFVWEYWQVFGQYAQHRVPLRTFFPDELATAFEARLLAWAGAHLGLSALGGPPWLSFLLHGDYQSLHRDTPNGEFAFSFGLSRPGAARFRGGETLLARPELLDYWRSGAGAAQQADAPLFDEVPSRFNRLVAFDSRVPHGVRLVEGPRSPADGRIAVQGWLVPRGVVVHRVTGGRRAVDAAVVVAVNETTKRALAGQGLARLARGLDGLYTVALDVAPDGRVRTSKPLVDTVVPRAERGASKLLDRIDAVLTALRFSAVPLVRARVRVVVPVVVRDGRVALGDGACG
jgi:hypothetical protein